MSSESSRRESIEVTRDAVSGAQVLAGHLVEGSDLAHDEAAGAIVPVLDRLLAERPASRVLLAGPRAALLVNAVPSSEHVDVLVRTLPDVRTIGDLAGLRSGVHLYCGGLDAFTAERPYDLIVALGGPGRLLGPDSSGMTTTELVGHLTGLLSEAAHLVLDLANELGLDNLVSARPDPELDSDRGWHVGADGFAGRRLFAREREPLLAAHGLVPVVTYAALPSPAHHRVLVRSAALTTPALVEGAATVAGRSLDDLLTDGPVLREPRATVHRVVEAGLLDELSPGWLVVARRGAGAEPQTPPTPRTRKNSQSPQAFPVMVALEPASRWQTVLIIDADVTQTISWADPTGGAGERSEGALVRSLGAETATGGSLELRMREACASRNHARVRAEVAGYAAWVHDETRWGSHQPARVFATPANTGVDEAGGLHLLDASWQFGSMVTADEALVRGLRDFARRLLASASVHPWRVGTTPDELTTTLAAMVGVTVTTGAIERIARVEGEIEALRRGTPHRVDEIALDNLESGRFGRDLPVRDAAGYRELLAHDRSASRTLREQQGQVAWLEGTLRHRDRYIRRLERVIESYEHTLTYRAVEAIRSPRRIATAKAVSAAKSTANDVLPPEAMSKARRLASRLLS